LTVGISRPLHPAPRSLARRDGLVRLVACRLTQPARDAITGLVHPFAQLPRLVQLRRNPVAERRVREAHLREDARHLLPDLLARHDVLRVVAHERRGRGPSGGEGDAPDPLLRHGDEATRLGAFERTALDSRGREAQ
jgi:hypothetical protein